MGQACDWDRYCKFKPYLSVSLSLCLLLMRSSQPHPPLGPKPTNSVGWTNSWLNLPLMRDTLVSGATKQQTAVSLVWTLNTENICYLQNMSLQSQVNRVRERSYFFSICANWWCSIPPLEAGRDTVLGDTVVEGGWVVAWEGYFYSFTKCEESCGVMLSSESDFRRYSRVLCVWLSCLI